ncbi:MAG: hypothetical protein IID00_03790 [Chloroflexi bacterium]|nr:hypothetical protein [Chloroflexota bacterium]
MADLEGTPPTTTGSIISAPARWSGGADLPLLFADHLWAANISGHFQLTFGHSELPYEFVTPELVTKLEKEGVEIKSITRIAIGPSELESMIQLLTGVLQQWKDRRASDAK